MSERATRPIDPASNGPTQADYDDALGEFTEIRTAMQRLASKASKVMNRYEAKGGDPDDIRFGHKLGKLSKSEAAAKLAGMVRIGVWSGIQIAYEADGQASFSTTFDAPAAGTAGMTVLGSRVSMARAYSDGWNTGKAGGALADNNYSAFPGSEEFGKWADGFGDGMEDRPDPIAKEAKKNRKNGAKAEAESPSVEVAPEEKPAPRKRGQRLLAAPDVASEEMPEPPPPIH